MSTGNPRHLLANALLSSNLSHNPNRETAPDRIGALAFSDALGAKLWRLRWADDSACFAPAVQLLADRVADRERHRNDAWSVIETLCGIVVNEWLFDLCKTCAGRGYSVIEGTGRAGRSCSTCNGTGNRRYSDQERMGEMGFTLSIYKKWAPRFAQAHSILAEADASTGRAVPYQLGRVCH